MNTYYKMVVKLYIHDTQTYEQTYSEGRESLKANSSKKVSP